MTTPREGWSRVVPIREGHAERIKELKGRMEAELGSARVSLRVAIESLREACEDAYESFPFPPGEREEYRQIAESLKASMTRLTALGRG